MKTAVKKIVLPAVISLIFSAATAAQDKEDISVLPPTKSEIVSKVCKNLVLGKIISNPKPDYPAEAKNLSIGGTVEVSVKVDEKGSVFEAEKVSGNPIFREAAIKSALQAKFSPTVCDNVPARISGTVIYNFMPSFYTDTYFTPAAIENLTDVDKDSPYYETLIDLVENDKTAFGFADQKYHAEAPLTRGDFAQFLRLTLEMLSERAKIAGRPPRDKNLFYPHNPRQIQSADKILDWNARQPFADSVKILLVKYNITLTGDDYKVHGYEPLTRTELIDLWTAIFGEDAFPVNFNKSENGGRIITRGEFALFLQESLDVLNYKVLP